MHRSLTLVWHCSRAWRQPPCGPSRLSPAPVRKASGGRAECREAVVTILAARYDQGREKHIPYAGTNNPAQTLDLLLPKKRTDDKPLPVVVNIHGGAFKMGDKSMGVGEMVTW